MGVFSKVANTVIGGTFKGAKLVAVGRPGYTADGTRKIGGLLGLIDKPDWANELHVLKTHAEGIDTAAKWAFKGITHEVSAGDAKTMVGAITGRELNLGAAIVIGGALTAGAVGNETLKVSNKMDRGQSLGVVNMPGVTSPIPDVGDTKEIENTSFFEHVDGATLDNYGATGDIVFALNNQR